MVNPSRFPRRLSAATPAEQATARASVPKVRAERLPHSSRRAIPAHVDILNGLISLWRATTAESRTQTQAGLRELPPMATQVW